MAFAMCFHRIHSLVILFGEKTIHSVLMRVNVFSITIYYVFLIITIYTSIYNYGD